MAHRSTALVFLFTVVISGCATAPSNYTQWFYPTLIESDPPGVKIEVNGGYEGNTPLTIVLPRMYRSEWVGLLYGGTRITSVDPITIIAYPVLPGQYTQTKYIGMDQGVPRRMFFDMGLVPTAQRQEIDLNVR